MAMGLVMLRGVIILKAAVADEPVDPLLCVILTGIMTRQPIMLRKTKMLRHIVVKRRKITASRPTVSISCDSRV